jgi:hypothetical protein
VVGVACILLAEGWTPGRVYAHKETATPDGRKPDPAFGSTAPKPYPDMDRFRGQVRTAMTAKEEPDVTDDQAKQLKYVYDAIKDTAEGKDIDIMSKLYRLTVWGSEVKGDGRPNLEDVVARLAAVEGKVDQLLAPPPPA